MAGGGRGRGEFAWFGLIGRGGIELPCGRVRVQIGQVINAWWAALPCAPCVVTAWAVFDAEQDGERLSEHKLRPEIKVPEGGGFWLQLRGG